ncbi:hypothetical protein LUZ60_007053 [Juncus effusus]|nr:hypothetical protein LUZ60_007053 [Juncus effusus]
MYGSRGAMAGQGGVSESGYSEEGSTKRHQQSSRITDSTPSYFAVSSTDSKRSRGPDPSSHQYYSPAANPSAYYRTPPFMTAGAYQGAGSTAGLYNFPVVRIRGLPFNCDDMDIYKFFSGLDIVDCVFVNKNGRFTGDAFVVFPTPVQAQFALQRDRQMMGHRYVEVFSCKKSDYYNAIAAEVNSGGYGGYMQDRSPPAPPPQPRTKRPRSEPRDDTKNIEDMHFTEVLKLRGLPYSATRSEIVNFFGGDFDVKESRVHIACRFDGKPTGEAFVEFESVEAAKRAMSRDKMMIGSRYVELFPSSFEEAGRAKSRAR